MSFRKDAYLFGTPNMCKLCRRELPSDYKDELCPNCKERELFSQVKEFIRANDVTEYQVADHFNIPLSRVKHWIREGRIEYKEVYNTPVLQSTHCQSCGIPIRFGSLCPACQRKANMTGSSSTSFSHSDDRFLFLQK